jgi:ATP-binding cassette subfamily F protein uup
VVLVSHDRYFLDRTVETIFRFEGNGLVREYPGNYSAFREIKGREREESPVVRVAKAVPADFFSSGRGAKATLFQGAARA